jgi:hypothetical protein
MTADSSPLLTLASLANKPLNVPNFVTPSNVNLCHSFLASILSRKWLSAGDGYST